MAENKKVYVVGQKLPEKRMSLVVQGSLTRRHNMYWNTLA